jgi:ATP-binding cassette subfamily A (ABC1) protein 3
LREIIGICNQRDVLYEEMTAEEHLRFLGTVKGRVGEELVQEIEEILEKT